MVVRAPSNLVKSNARTRYPRLRIAGTIGWEINKAGTPYKHDKRQPVTNLIAGLPTIDFAAGGSRYINGKQVKGDYWGPIPASDGGWGDSRRLLDEIVCLAFHGYPPGGIMSGSYPLHLDDNDWNCHADNLRWSTVNGHPQYLKEKSYQRLMRPDFLPYRQLPPVPTKLRKELAWMESKHQWEPVEALEEIERKRAGK